MDEKYKKYFTQTTDSSSALTADQPSATPQAPIAVRNVYSPGSATSILNYGVQGIIYSIAFTLITVLGQPILKYFSLTFSEKAREKQARESHAYNAQIALVDELKKQQGYIQELMSTQQKHSNDEMAGIFNRLIEQVAKLEASHRQNAERISAILRGTEIIKIQISQVHAAIPVRIVNNPQDPSLNNQHSGKEEEPYDNQEDYPEY